MKDTYFQLRLSATEKQEIKRLSKSKRVTMSDIIRWFIQKGWSKAQNTPKDKILSYLDKSSFSK